MHVPRRYSNQKNCLMEFQQQYRPKEQHSIKEITKKEQNKNTANKRSKKKKTSLPSSK